MLLVTPSLRALDQRVADESEPRYRTAIVAKKNGPRQALQNSRKRSKKVRTRLGTLTGVVLRVSLVGTRIFSNVAAAAPADRVLPKTAFPEAAMSRLAGFTTKSSSSVAPATELAGFQAKTRPTCKMRPQKRVPRCYFPEGHTTYGHDCH